MIVEPAVEVWEVRIGKVRKFFTSEKEASDYGKFRYVHFEGVVPVIKRHTLRDFVSMANAASGGLYEVA